MASFQESSTGGIPGKLLAAVTEAVPYMFFIPVYTFFILYYQQLIKRFLIGLFKNHHEARVREVLLECICVSQRYSSGLLIEMIIVFVLNTVAFLVLGIPYALFMGLLAALLNVIPYVGMACAVTCCTFITVISCHHMGEVPQVIAVLIGAHLIDNSLIMPVVVGSKVRINALAILVGIVPEVHCSGSSECSLQYRLWRFESNL